MEFKKPVQALKDPNKHAIGTKWVFRNKKNKRGIMVKNKARLVAQGYTQEEVYQMDVKSDFLYGMMEEEVYICQLPSFEDLDFHDKVYKVEKALFGLHQAPRACQDKYVADILKKFDFSTVKTASTPMEPNKALVKDAKAKDVDVHLYRSMIVSLMYLTASKPDITFAVYACVMFRVTLKTSHLHDDILDPQTLVVDIRILLLHMDQDEGIKLVADQEKDAEVEGRHADKQAELYNLDLDHSSKVLSMQEDDTEVQEAVEIVTTAKLMTEVVTTTATQAVAASTPIPAAKPKILNFADALAVSIRMRKGVVIRDAEEELPSDTLAETPKVNDKGKGILIEAPKPMKKKDQIEMDAEYARKLQEEINKEHKETYKNIDWNAALDHVQSKEPQYIKRYHGMKKKPQTESEPRKNMIFYLKNTKEEMEEEDEEIIKSINETPAQKAAKRRKLHEQAKEDEDLKKMLEVVDDEDDDVFIEATPIGRKVPVELKQILNS
nr:hypothetical protein [Tanacetum cinerariifolium]